MSDRPTPRRDEDGVLLGGLPRSRPAVRTPGRERAAQARAKTEAAAEAERPVAAQTSATQRGEGPIEPERPASAAQNPLEQAARLGVGIAVGGLATGARLAGRALGALRRD